MNQQVAPIEESQTPVNPEALALIEEVKNLIRNERLSKEQAVHARHAIEHFGVQPSGAQTNASDYRDTAYQDRYQDTVYRDSSSYRDTPSYRDQAK